MIHALALLNVTGYVASAGYAAIFVLSVLQSCCVPTSSELTLGFAGVLVAEHKLSLAGVILAGAAGEVVGAFIAYAVGKYGGRPFVDRYGRYVLLTHRDLDRAEAWYHRHPQGGVFYSRLLPVIRNFVAVPAGVAEVPLVRFGVLTALGSVIWDGLWAILGYAAGGVWKRIAHGVSDAGYLIFAVAVVLIAVAIYHRWRSYKRIVAEDGEQGAAAPVAVPSTPAHLARRQPAPAPAQRPASGLGQRAAEARRRRDGDR